MKDRLSGVLAALPWIVLPVFAPKPPPKDPTGLRLTKTLGEAIQSIVQEDVHITSREARDEHCPTDDARCTAYVAESLGAHRAIALILSPDYKKVEVRIYKDAAGVEREGEIPCTWVEGDVKCETDKLAPLLKRENGPPPVDPEKVRESFDALLPKLARCNKGAKVPDNAWVSFRVRPDGHAIDVRIQPEELSDDPAFQCMARTVESLRTSPFTADKPEPFRFSLAPPKPAKSKVDRKKKSR